MGNLILQEESCMVQFPSVFVFQLLRFSYQVSYFGSLAYILSLNTLRIFSKELTNFLDFQIYYSRIFLRHLNFLVHDTQSLQPDVSNEILATLPIVSDNLLFRLAGASDTFMKRNFKRAEDANIQHGT